MPCRPLYRATPSSGPNGTSLLFSPLCSLQTHTLRLIQLSHFRQRYRATPSSGPNGTSLLLDLLWLVFTPVIVDVSCLHTHSHLHCITHTHSHLHCNAHAHTCTATHTHSHACTALQTHTHISTALHRHASSQNAHKSTEEERGGGGGGGRGGGAGRAPAGLPTKQSTSTAGGLGITQRRTQPTQSRCTGARWRRPGTGVCGEEQGTRARSQRARASRARLERQHI